MQYNNDCYSIHVYIGMIECLFIYMYLFIYLFICIYLFIYTLISFLGLLLTHRKLGLMRATLDRAQRIVVFRYTWTLFISNHYFKKKTKLVAMPR
ncbi:hypothetical protein BDF14DRAFT_1816524 [Spinellus fusiger]|nr:hypothetical protein BDF14DRAFT_1816524 [Spinellus fusiger]